MPRDYPFMAKAVSGFLSGKGRGRIAGGPEGLSRVNPVTAQSAKSYDAPLPGTGVIRGTPRGIKGSVRRASFRKALSKRLAG